MTEEVRHAKVQAKTGCIFEVDTRALRQSKILSIILIQYELDDTKMPIDAHQIDGHILRLMLTWCEHHKLENPRHTLQHAEEVILPQWDNYFLRRICHRDLFNLTNAAYEMGVFRLWNYACKAIQVKTSEISIDTVRTYYSDLYDIIEIKPGEQ